MAQNGFAGFFLLTLVGGAFMLALSLLESWPRIVSAIKGSTGLEVTALTYTTVHRMPADIPAVAQRLLMTSLDEEAHPIDAPAGWMMRRFPKSGNQLAFQFA